MPCLLQGVLIVGERGTGKTSLALAIAAEAKVPVVNIKAQELEAGLWVGQSASNVRELFQTARDLVILQNLLCFTFCRIKIFYLIWHMQFRRVPYRLYCSFSLILPIKLDVHGFYCMCDSGYNSMSKTTSWEKKT